MRDGYIPVGTAATVTPRMLRAEFVAALPGAELFDEGARYASYAVGPITVEGRAFDMVATFEDDTLFLVSLAPAEIGDAGWAGLSSDLSKRLKLENDRWLSEWIGQTSGSFEWGRIDSMMDQKTGFPNVVVKYAAKR